MTRVGAADTVFFGAAGAAADDAGGFRAAGVGATGADFGTDFGTDFGVAGRTAFGAAGLRGLAAAFARFACSALCCSMRCCSSAVQTF